jgi:hypothetical protein
MCAAAAEDLQAKDNSCVRQDAAPRSRPAGELHPLEGNCAPNGTALDGPTVSGVARRSSDLNVDRVTAKAMAYEVATPAKEGQMLFVYRQQHIHSAYL